ncbi:ELMO/CED-12 FAMILY PROTEIN [Salix koriyanagi]|uniref:ELMO/CED-12 FAMILY PROTEIN n=1 Tax=Salix koriyanagi TaxID=2511006 RepID=A0A9Q1AFE2_9ROSI|nr:ELMO/CED-12 FAMILY PROTEIN [Salix koriyanagi]
MKVYFDASRPDHQDALRALWSATYPDQELNGLISDQWKEMGWQGRDPSTDFRGAGFISLENLLFFAKTFTTSFQQLLKKQGGKRSAWEYPFAVAGVNITFMIMQMLDLDALKSRRTFVRSVFLQMLSENEWAFDLLYCVAFVVMDKQWLERNATYMEFNVRIYSLLFSFCVHRDTWFSSSVYQYNNTSWSLQFKSHKSLKNIILLCLCIRMS